MTDAESLFIARQMYEQACCFAACADLCNRETKNEDTFPLWTPGVVNSAFACELFLKALLQALQINIERVHGLKKLFHKFPQEYRERIDAELLIRYGGRKDVFGQDKMDRISDAFKEWRYSYEKDRLQIDIGFLTTFRDILKDIGAEVLGYR